MDIYSYIDFSLTLLFFGMVTGGVVVAIKDAFSR